MLLSADSRQSPRESKLIRAQLQRGATPPALYDPLRYCRELAHFPPAAGRPGRPVLLSRQVTMAGQGRASEGARLILLPGTVVRHPLDLHPPPIPPPFPPAPLRRRRATPPANPARRP